MWPSPPLCAAIDANVDSGCTAQESRLPPPHTAPITLVLVFVRLGFVGCAVGYSSAERQSPRIRQSADVCCKLRRLSLGEPQSPCFFPCYDAARVCFEGQVWLPRRQCCKALQSVAQCCTVLCSVFSRSMQLYATLYNTVMVESRLNLRSPIAWYRTFPTTGKDATEYAPTSFVAFTAGDVARRDSRADQCRPHRCRAD